MASLDTAFKEKQQRATVCSLKEKWKTTHYPKPASLEEEDIQTESKVWLLFIPVIWDPQTKEVTKCTLES